MMLSCSHIKTTRYAHEVRAIALTRLKMEAYERYKVDNGDLDHNKWNVEKRQKYQTLFFGIK